MKFFEQVHALVRCVPPGRVATYGQIARLLGHPQASRTVGWALRAVPTGSGVPWQRVISSSGRISISDPESAAEQRRLLEAEGVVFGHDGRIDLDVFGWAGISEPEIRALMVRARRDDDST